MAKKQKVKTIVKYIKEKDNSTEKEDDVIKKNLRVLEEKKAKITESATKASQGKGLFKRIAIGFKANVKQASLNAEIKDSRNFLRAKRQQGLFREQAKALEERKKLQALRESNKIDYDKIFGAASNKAVNFKPISMGDIYR